jgi:hypothetical protein
VLTGKHALKPKTMSLYRDFTTNYLVPNLGSDAEAGNRFAASLPVGAAHVVAEVLQARCSASRSSGTDRSTPSRDSIRAMRAETVLR